MTWALVFMLCTPTCVVEYVQAYPTRQECVKNITKNAYYTQKCVPISKD